MRGGQGGPAADRPSHIRGSELLPEMRVIPLPFQRLSFPLIEMKALVRWPLRDPEAF